MSVTGNNAAMSAAESDRLTLVKGASLDSAGAVSRSDSNAHSDSDRRRYAGLRPFPKGVSGNPNGRPVVPASVVNLARGHTALAIATLAAICEAKRASPAAKVQAAVALLDRAWGKPVQPIESKNLNVNVNAYSDSELLAIVARARGAADLAMDHMATADMATADSGMGDLGVADLAAG